MTDQKINEEEAHWRDIVSRESENVEAWANLGKVLNIKCNTQNNTKPHTHMTHNSLKIGLSRHSSQSS